MTDSKLYAVWAFHKRGLINWVQTSTKQVWNEQHLLGGFHARNLLV